MTARNTEELEKLAKQFWGCCHGWRHSGHTPWCRYHPDNRPRVRDILKERGDD